MAFISTEDEKAGVPRIKHSEENVCLGWWHFSLNNVLVTDAYGFGST